MFDFFSYKNRQTDPPVILLLLKRHESSFVLFNGIIIKNQIIIVHRSDSVDVH